MLLIRKNFHLFSSRSSSFSRFFWWCFSVFFRSYCYCHIRARTSNLLMTRSRGWVWTHFILESSGSRNGTCTFCAIVYKGGKTNRMLVHLARACNRISAEVKREALSRLPATEILPNESAASECCVGESDTSTIFNCEVVVGGQPVLSRRPRDDNFDSADDREMENPLGILQRPHVQRALSIHGGRA